MSNHNRHYFLHSRKLTLVVEQKKGAAAIIYFGQRLDDAVNATMLSRLSMRQETAARAHDEAPISLCPEVSRGFLGGPGIQCHRDGRRWALYSEIEHVDNSHNTLVIRAVCQGVGVRVLHHLFLDFESDVLTAFTELVNIGVEDLAVDLCNPPTIPLPDHCRRVTGFGGRWALEGQLISHHLDRGIYLRENRTGRTSHDCPPFVLVREDSANDISGTAYGFHLGWSGNHRIRIEELSDGRAYVQLGELFHPGEIILAPKKSYTTPILYVSASVRGCNRLSQNFHNYVRQNLIAPHMLQKQKPVHFNSWEAVYFDLSPSKLKQLAKVAVQIGVERFVLDDGWFRHRRDDTAGLGDWYVDKAIFPDGLGDLIDYVNECGMEFGLWLEPEMVSPNSDLYRQNPNWVLGANPAPTLLARHQLVLNLTLPEVQEYLFERIDMLLDEYPVRYLKWDMNREIHQPCNAQGRAVVHEQTKALYALLDRIRQKHTELEIESCASGGGRVDFGILPYIDRFWTSDSNDALDRLAIQDGFSMFLPVELMGSHVGPKTCHITGRVFSMDLRCGVAMFGDMGIEANLLDMDVEEKQVLANGIALHKKYRSLIFSGNRLRIPCADYEHAFAIVSKDRTFALYSYTLLSSQPHSAPGRLRFSGLASDKRYRMRFMWPEQPLRKTPSVLDTAHNQVFLGSVLINHGMQLPVMRPGSQLVIELKEY